jgi:hypothetical protein
MVTNRQTLTPIQRHMLNMFIALRWGVGLAGLALPVILTSVGYLKYRIPISGSMSAYYHATEACSGQTAEDGLQDPAKAPAACLALGTGPMRNWFVGSLFLLRLGNSWVSVDLSVADQQGSDRAFGMWNRRSVAPPLSRCGSVVRPLHRASEEATGRLGSSSVCHLHLNHGSPLRPATIGC